MTEKNFSEIMQEVRQCTLCKEHLPHSPNPVLAASESSPLVIIGQAPGIVAHDSSTPWNDRSGDRLRDWLGMSRDTFYDTQCVSLVPMGFCFPGYLKGADAPPRKECAPAWHDLLFSRIKPEMTLLVGRYAQKYYLPQYKTLTEAVAQQAQTHSGMLVLPHPSGRNNRWLTRHPWFEDQVVPLLKKRVRTLITDRIA
ncbi:uracil-DNA glycosylase family protein [Alteromonas pelagimontana]|uniref:Uracil-DNA glycosylase family protein n=1 Tax=Alteromonas pelagimontana TaxID=1858656 RepID=A0A6M4MG54_9ALTE|nr:uracil-DNA glycosylase family protein [Alteromonas pelagimontana]QJR81620.1 uracil-DNA glycosylase family protein [Alteromonas pelagimontana]